MSDSPRPAEPVTLRRVTAPRLATLVACVVGCSASPQELGEGDADEGVTIVAEGELEASTAAPTPEPVEPVADPTLASARQGVRNGQVAASMRAQLIASPNPDHRHAARLLQAIAGEQPAPVLSRAGARSIEAGAARPVAPPAERPGEDAKPPLAERPQTEASEERPPPSIPPAPEPVERAPEPTPEPEQAAEQVPEAEQPDPALVAQLLHERLAGWSEPSRPLLLRERPPREQESNNAGSGPQLVILTSLALRPSDAGASLALMGAGAVELEIQPIDAYHLRLSVVGAGAVPGFLDARPSVPGLEVVSVARFGRVIEVELEHGPGWWLESTTRVDNGAVAEFYRVPESSEDVSP